MPAISSNPDADFAPRGVRAVPAVEPAMEVSPIPGWAERFWEYGVRFGVVALGVLVGWIAAVIIGVITGWIPLTC